MRIYSWEITITSFDEGVRKSSLEAMGVALEDIIVVVDEAHNLPNRIRMTMEKIITPPHVLETQRWNWKNMWVHSLHITSNRIQYQAHLELDVATWAFEIMKIARTLSSLICSGNSTTDLPNDSNESRVEVSRFLEIIHRSCDEYEGLTGQKTLTDNPDLADLSVERSHRLPRLSDLLLRVEIDLEAGDDEDAMEPDSHRMGHILKCIETFGETTALSLVFSSKKGQGWDNHLSHLLDPGLVSGPVFSSIHGAILMSGTLYPPQMYADMLDLPAGQNYQNSVHIPICWRTPTRFSCR